MEDSPTQTWVTLSKSSILLTLKTAQHLGFSIYRSQYVFLLPKQTTLNCFFCYINLEAVRFLPLDTNFRGRAHTIFSPYPAEGPVWLTFLPGSKKDLCDSLPGD